MPKNLYKSSLDCERGISEGVSDGLVGVHEVHLHVNEDMYKTVDLQQGDYFEIVLKNTDIKSVLTWDFDVHNTDVKFTVFRTMGLSKDIEQGPKNSHPMSVLEESKLIEDGVDFVKEEPPLMCRPKESVQVIIREGRLDVRCHGHVHYNSISFLSHLQGSHVMDTRGTYILQWHCPAGQQHQTGNAQLLYYYEVLSSESYRGSMTSLQSGFSAMSVASSCQSR